MCIRDSPSHVVAVSLAVPLPGSPGLNSGRLRGPWHSRKSFLAQTFGKYEVVTELYSTPEGSVYSARPVGSRRPGDAASARPGESAPVPASRGPRELREVRYAVKVYNPTGLDMDELFWESQSFLERARLQQRTADAGNGNWAPVHEMGTSPAGAYYVTDFHPLSVAGLVAGRAEVGPGVLY